MDVRPRVVAGQGNLVIPAVVSEERRCAASVPLQRSSTDVGVVVVLCAVPAADLVPVGTAGRRCIAALPFGRPTYTGNDVSVAQGSAPVRPTGSL